MNKTKTKILQLFIFAFAFAFAAPSYAQTTDWVETLGARMRVHFAPNNETGQAADQWRAVLDVELEEGWKTYWLDPGASGIPPQINVTAGDAHSIETQLIFPAPTQLGEGEDVFAGYKKHLKLGIVPAGANGAVPQKLDVFMGLCSDICVPFQTQFTLEQDASPHAAALTTYFVAKAFDAMPQNLSAPLEATAMDENRVSFTFDHAGDGPFELFIAAEKGWIFGHAVTNKSNQGAIFELPIIKRGEDGAKLPITITQDGSPIAWSGVMAVK